jgi:hypothetical protein
MYKKTTIMNTLEQAFQPDELEDDDTTVASSDDAIEDDGTPVLDETDLEENGLTEEDAVDIEWEEEAPTLKGGER